MRRIVILALLIAGCRTEIPFDPGGVRAVVVVPEIADMAQGADLADVPDLAVPPDLSRPDMAADPDLAHDAPDLFSHSWPCMCGPPTDAGCDRCDACNGACCIPWPP